MVFENIHNEKELLALVANGDRAAFGKIHQHYYPLVRHYVILFMRSAESVQELTQDVFVRIWDKRDKLGVVESFKSYLFLVTRNLIFNYIRALRTQRQHSSLESTGELAGGEDTESTLLFKQYYQILEEGIGKLPEGRRKVLIMSIEDGLSLDEIAERLGISRSGVKKQLYAATGFLRQYLQENGELSLFLLLFLSLLEH